MSNKQLVKGLLAFRLPLIIALNLVITSISFLLALLLRFEFSIADLTAATSVVFPLTLLLLFRTGTYTYWGLHQGYWRYVSTHDLFRIVSAHLASTVLFAAAVLFFRVSGFPRSVLFVELALSILFSGGARVLVREIMETYLRHNMNSGSTPREVLILGGGDSGHLLVKYLLSNSRLNYKIVGVLDDSDRLAKGSVLGVSVLGPLNKLESILEKYPRIAAVIVAIPSLSKARFEMVEKTCKLFGIALKRLQAFEDIACQDFESSPEKISIESVLEKETRVEHEEEIRRALKGKRILITGAGGSIGSELVRQILPFEPGRLILLDNSEFHLFSIERELAQTRNHCDLVLGSIGDRRRLSAIFSEKRPDIVFHAAAYKHVPLLESNCYEAFVNNVLGTRNLLEVSRVHGVKLFVMISTDKAVEPSSVMGASKRIAEMLAQDCCSHGTDAQNMYTAVVRFGNVINSRGSVIPLFKEQILSGGPLTVTHPEMERYFMSLREAVRLVLTAGTLGMKGEIYILNMGEPIRVVDVAKKMLSLYGRRDIPIVFTGVRPGEKLKEDLTDSGENVDSTSFAKVNRVKTNSFRRQSIAKQVVQLELLLSQISDEEIGRLMKEIVLTNGEIEMQPNEPSRVNGSGQHAIG